MSNVVNFINDDLGCQIIGILYKGEPVFEAVKVAETLGYSNTHDALKRHCDDCIKLSSSQARELELPDSIGNRQGVILIPESDLYSLILSSKLETAKPFKKWVTSEVIPAIRKTGVYLTNKAAEEIISNPDFIIKLATQVKEERAGRIFYV